MPLKRAVTEFGKTYKDRFALRTYPGTSVPIFIFILGWSRTKPRVTLSAQTMDSDECEELDLDTDFQSAGGVGDSPLAPLEGCSCSKSLESNLPQWFC